MKKLYYNGPILTMVQKPARRAITRELVLPEALLTEDERILAVGSLEELRQKAAPEVEMQDLQGHTLLPAFIDSHSHFAAAANAMLQCGLDKAYSLVELKKQLVAFAKTVPAGEWVQGQGYDHNQLTERRHPTRWELDEAIPDHPVMIVHKSGHVGVFNTKALERLGLLGQPAPVFEGGRIEMQNGELTGYMEETAFLAYQKQVPMSDQKAFDAALQKAQQLYASNGITTVQEGFFVGQLTPIYQQLLKEQGLWLDVIAYIDAQTASEIQGQFPQSDRRYDRHFKIGGYKIFLDGSPQGRTAWLRKPYENSPGYYGYPTLTDEEVEAALIKSAEEQMPLLAHCNGDAAALQLMNAVERVRAEYPELPNPVMIHAQLLPPEEMERIKRLGIIPSFFVAHIYHWGEIHLQNLGAARAHRLSPAGSALRAGIPFTLHQDTPVIPPDMLETLWCAACRHTQTGRILGEDETIPVWNALQAITIHAAMQYGEDSEKGSLAEGKKADMVILDQNPLEVDAEKLRDLRVLETIKDGKTIYHQ